MPLINAKGIIIGGGQGGNENDFYETTVVQLLNGWMGTARCTRRNGIVTIAFYDIKKTVIDETEICILPTWACSYTTTSYLYFPIFSTTSHHATLALRYDGTVHLLTPSTTLNNVVLRATATYIGRET